MDSSHYDGGRGHFVAAVHDGLQVLALDEDPIAWAVHRHLVGPEHVVESPAGIDLPSRWFPVIAGVGERQHH